MMGRLNHDQEQFFYSFRLDEAVPNDHPVREVAAVLDLSWVHSELAPYYPRIGRPSIDPVLMMRMLIIGYVFAIRSERALCRDVRVNLAYRWFCGLSIEDKIPDHSAFSRARNERFCDSGIFRSVFERVVGACIKAGLVGGEGFAVDASLIVADANKQRSTPGPRWNKELDAEAVSRATKEYLARLDDAAFGAASDVAPKFVSPSDPAAQWTGALRGPAFFAYSDNYLIDVKFGIIMDVEASRAIRQAEVGAVKTMIARTGGRQVEARGWDLQSRGLHIREEAQHLHLSGRQSSHHDWQGGHRWGDPVLPGQDTRLPQLPPQVAVLSKGAVAQTRAQHL